MRDAQVLPHLQRIHAENFGVYGVRKVYRQLRREPRPDPVTGQVRRPEVLGAVARATVARLMREHGLLGVSRGKVARTTIPAVRAPGVSMSTSSEASRLLSPDASSGIKPACVHPC